MSFARTPPGNEARVYTNLTKTTRECERVLMQQSTSCNVSHDRIARDLDSKIGNIELRLTSLVS